MQEGEEVPEWDVGPPPMPEVQEVTPAGSFCICCGKDLLCGPGLMVDDEGDESWWCEECYEKERSGDGGDEGQRQNECYCCGKLLGEGEIWARSNDSPARGVWSIH